LELNKIAIIHLYLLGFEDDLTNFNLSLNNPSKQLEILEMENMTKNIAAATSALNEQGCGIPLMSWRRTQKDIMGRTDGEIFEMINEIRLEKAMAEELVNTPQIIKKTGMFNNVDRIYGEPGAEYASNENQGDGMEGGPMGGGPMGGFDTGDLGDLGEPGGMEEGEIGGDEDTTPMDENMPMESVINNKNTINEKSAFNNYLNYLKGFKEKESDNEKIELLKNTIITETFKHDINTLQ
jgi:hypothetical protein